MKKFRLFSVILTVLFLLAAANAVSTPASRPAATQENAADFEQTCARAFKHLLKGEFSKGESLLAVAGAVKTDDTVTKARTLTGDYLKIRARSDSERQLELAAAVKRVRLARLAEKHRPELVKAKLADKLWGRVKAIADATSTADEFLAANSTSKPAKVRADALKHLDRASEEVSSSCALLADTKGQWAETFRATARGLEAALADYRKAWKKAGPSSDHRDALKAASEKVQDALIDTGVLATGEPLTAALSHAREARELAGDIGEFLRQEWVAELIRDADLRGRELIKKEKWIDALMIYGSDGLSGIDRDNVAFENVLKRANLHVRMLNLYGRNAATQPATGASTRPLPPSTTVRPGGPKWRDMIAGIDTVMVRTAIEQIDANYVKKPDYGKIGIAGLNAIKVLLESRPAAETLTVLKDDRKRLAFLKGVERQIVYLRTLKKPPDYLHVQEVLNRILDLNAETLNLPAEVVNMEFAEGMLTALDQFTSMIWPYQEEEFRKRTMGSFYGIGVQIRKQPGKPIEVVTPLADTPAFRAGIRAGDRIVKVGGRETKMMALDRAVKLITGKKGTTVTLTIRRAGRSKPFDVNIKRDTIHIQTVKGWRRRPGGKWDFILDADEHIGYIRLTQFTVDTSRELRRALRELRQAGVRGIIVDMRFNPGGLLTAAVDVADEFLRRGLIVSTKRRSQAQSEKTATALGQYQRGRVVVLVNQYSASAAEIVAGALKDWGRAKIVGQRTYGKGSVQRLIPLKSRRAKLKLTTAYYYLPSGRCLHRTNGAKDWGVDPDISVPVTVRQMNRWAEIRQETDILKDVDAGRLSGLLKKQLQQDIQLQAALLMLRLRLLADAQPLPAAKAA